MPGEMTFAGVREAVNKRFTPSPVQSNAVASWLNAEYEKTALSLRDFTEDFILDLNVERRVVTRWMEKVRGRWRWKSRVTYHPLHGSMSWREERESK